MTTGFWQQDKKDVAVALKGQAIDVGNLEAVILDTKGYTKEENSKGDYRDMLEMPPGQIYCPLSNSHVILLITALDKGEQGGCVLVKAIELDGKIIKGPALVARALGITQRGTRGSVTILGDRMVFGLNAVAIPQKVKSTPAPDDAGGGIDKATRKKYMPKISAKYMKDNPGTSFFEWVNEFVADCANEAALVKKLRS